MRVADDVAEIARRLKEIQDERMKAIQGESEVKPATPGATGATGTSGFVTPGGDYYDPYCG